MLLKWPHILLYPGGNCALIRSESQLFAEYNFSLHVVVNQIHSLHCGRRITLPTITEFPPRCLQQLMLFIDLPDVVMEEIGLAICQTGNTQHLCHLKILCPSSSLKSHTSVHTYLWSCWIYLSWSHFRADPGSDSSVVCGLLSLLPADTRDTNQQSEHGTIHDKRTSTLLNNYANSIPTNQSQSCHLWLYIT